MMFSIQDIWKWLNEVFADLDSWVRGTITFTLVGVYLYMQWVSPTPKEFVVPPSLVSAVGIVTGFYLAGDSSKCMKAALSIVYVITFAAFMAVHGWVPESVNTQVTTALGIWFGKKIVEAAAQIPKVQAMTVDQRQALQKDLAKPV